MAAMPIPPASAPNEAAPLSEPARVFNTFVSPGKTFSDLRRNASWWLPFLISALVSIAFVYVVDQKIGFEKVVENQLRARPKQADRLERMPADQREKAMQQQISGTKYFSYGFFLFLLAWNALIAAILYATLKFGLSAQIKFKTMYALVTFTGLPGVLKALLAMISILAGVSGDGFTFQNPVATNPGYFVDVTEHPALAGFLTGFDIFTIWTLILAAIGITYLTKVKSGAAYAVVFGWFVFLLLISAGATALFA